MPCQCNVVDLSTLSVTCTVTSSRSRARSVGARKLPFSPHVSVACPSRNGVFPAWNSRSNVTAAVGFSERRNVESAASAPDSG